MGEDGTLTVDGGAVEIAVVYFRAGYAPNDYFGRAEWDARLKLERSTAIKSPSIGYHLAGTKKVQQVLAQEGQVREEKGLTDFHRRFRSIDRSSGSTDDSNVPLVGDAVCF